jgi:hypothetical protein
MYLMLFGEIDETLHHPDLGGYDVHVVGAQRIIDQAVHRIPAASRKCELTSNATVRLVNGFIEGCR